MAEFSWDAKSPLHQAVMPKPFGDSATQPGVRLSEATGFTLLHIMARRGKWAETAKSARRCYRCDAPASPAAVFCKSGLLVWSGPDQFLALSPGAQRATSLDAVRLAFDGVASVSDQSDGRCLIRLSGRRVRDALVTLCSLDLHDTAFPIGAAAATSIDHSTVNLWRERDGFGGRSTFNMLVFTSFAESIWHALFEASAGYGVEVATETFIAAARSGRCEVAS